MNTRSVLALYDEFEDASSAVTDLTKHGFSDENITLLTQDATGQYARKLEDQEAVTAGEGAGLGAVTGLLVGLGAAVIPGVGPVIAAGPLAAALTGATVGVASGAVTGGIVGALVDIGVPEEEAHSYSEAVRRGGTLVMVQIHERGKVNKASNILGSHNPVDIKRRAGVWKEEEGWEAFDPEAEPYTAEDIERERAERRFEEHEPDFERHYNETYTGSVTYDGYRPAYRFGYAMAASPRYQQMEWEEVESAARQDWEDRYTDRPWVDYRDAVYFGWNHYHQSI